MSVAKYCLQSFYLTEIAPYFYGANFIQACCDKQACLIANELTATTGSPDSPKIFCCLLVFNTSKHLILMTPGKKMMLGIAAFLPIVSGIAFMVWYFSFFFHAMQQMAWANQNADPNAMFLQVMGIYRQALAFIVPLALVALTVMVIYIMQAVSNRRITDTERVIWILAFILAGSIAFPVYFFMRIFGRQSDAGVATGIV